MPEKPLQCVQPVQVAGLFHCVSMYLIPRFKAGIQETHVDAFQQQRVPHEQNLSAPARRLCEAAGFHRLLYVSAMNLLTRPSPNLATPSMQTNSTAAHTSNARVSRVRRVPAIGRFFSELKIDEGIRVGS